MLLPTFLLEDTAKVEQPPRGGCHLRPFWVGYFSNRYLSVTIRGVGGTFVPAPRGEGGAESGRRQKKEQGKACCRRDLHLRYNNNVCACKSPSPLRVEVSGKRKTPHLPSSPQGTTPHTHEVGCMTTPQRPHTVHSYQTT